jgi:hypothetical protein
MKRHFDIEVLVGQSKMAAWIRRYYMHMIWFSGSS